MTMADRLLRNLRSPYRWRFTRAPLYTALCLMLVAGLSGCSRLPDRNQTTETNTAAGPTADSNITQGCLDHFDPAMDYFPAKTSLQYAENFSVEYHKSYKVVTLKESYDGGPPERYLLVQCGAPEPEISGPPPAVTVTIPVESLFSESTTHLPLLVELDRVRVLRGVATIGHITTDSVLKWIEQNDLPEYAPRGEINAELVIAAAPSLLMAAGMANTTYSVIRNAGIPVVSNTEWLEHTPLGRAEWIKYMAVFLNEEAKAQERFAEIRERYSALASTVASLPAARKPLVMTGTAARGMFTVAGGQSYVAKLIADAGGTYAWSDDNHHSIITVDMETALEKASTADIWINGGDWRDLPSMLKEEPRYARFKAFQQGQVWLYNLKVNASGGNDYWSRGSTRPDMVLADLIRIFHPEAAPAHEFQWYRRVPGNAP